MSRTWCVVLLALGVSACSPDIYPDVYLCGPAMLCPEGQACSPGTELCTLPADVEAFACPVGTQVAEPDDLPADAQGYALTCGFGLEVEGCLVDGGDVDVLRFEVPAGCVDNMLRLDLRSALAFATVAVTFTDEAGNVLAADDCNPAAVTGAETSLCTALTQAPAVIYATVDVAADADTCGGTCAFNRYLVTARVAS